MFRPYRIIMKPVKCTKLGPFYKKQLYTGSNFYNEIFVRLELFVILHC